MKSVIAASLLVVIAAIVGRVWQAQPWQIDHIGQPADQRVLAHDDSAYASSSWVASPAENYFQLRFFDRVEGGVCLRPTWAELRELAAKDQRLAHLVPSGPAPQPRPGEKTWDYEWLPDPGTLPNTRYVCTFPAAVLLNQRLMTAAGEDPRAATPSICVVGLGSGVGIAVYAHHFPQASITVVDIDEVVIDLVRHHYPYLAWLEQQKTADGRPRLEMVAQDARKFIKQRTRQGARWDVIVLDAYTSGSTIPPHLMTREFYKECGEAMAEDGILLSNIIGSYERPATGGTKHKVLGGAIRSMIAAGLPEVISLPIPRVPGEERFDGAEIRNNVVMAARKPLAPRRAAAGWERLRAFQPYPELAVGAYVSRVVALVDNDRYVSKRLPLELFEQADPGFRKRLQSDPPGAVTLLRSTERAVLEQAGTIVADAYRGRSLPKGWRDAGSVDRIHVEIIDWVQYVRGTWATAVKLGTDPRHLGETLVGATEADLPASLIPTAPLFTDAKPNADIYNTGG